MEELDNSDNADAMANNISDIVKGGEGNKIESSEGGSSSRGQRMKEVKW